MADTPWTEEVTAQPCSCGHPGCNQYILSTQRSSGFSKGDALLYAAAPDMAEALERLDLWFDTDPEILAEMTDNELADHRRQHSIIKAALAKARGEQ